MGSDGIRNTRRCGASFGPKLALALAQVQLRLMHSGILDSPVASTEVCVSPSVEAGKASMPTEADEVTRRALAAKAVKVKVEAVAAVFNKKPKKGIVDMQACGLLSSPLDAEEVRGP